jgi:hypothetical protein
MKEVYLPLEQNPVCGHYFGHPFIRGDMLHGRTEEHRAIKRNGVKFITTVEHGDCSKCNKAADKRIMKQIESYEKTGEWLI